MTQPDVKKFPISEKLNIALFFFILPFTWGLLWVASHESLALALLAAWLFSIVNNLPFSLLHEAVHDMFSSNRFRNILFGTLCATAFPTSFTLQKIAHLGHHRRNRTDQELYDYYLPDQSKALRNFNLYAGNLFGLYWFCIPYSNLIFLLAPWLYTSKWFVEGYARVMGFEAYVKEIVAHSKLHIWLECLLAFSYQAMLWWALDLSWQGWLLCYWAFALHWSVLQYADHAWSARSVRDGAWNLKVLPPFRWVALNYHYHLAHHQHPDVPWYKLPGLVDHATPQPSFWRVYFSLWKGVRPSPPMGAPADLAFLFPHTDIPANESPNRK